MAVSEWHRGSEWHREAKWDREAESGGETVAGHRVHVMLDSDLAVTIDERVKAHGGRRGGAFRSREVNRLIRLGLQAETAGHMAAFLAPPLSDALDSRFAHFESWLRPIVAKTGIYAATTTLMVLELLTGQRVPREQAREFLELIRGRGYRLFRRPDDVDAGSATDRPGSDNQTNRSGPDTAPDRPGDG